MSILLLVVAVVVGAFAGFALSILGWYTGPAWSVYALPVPIKYPLIGAASGAVVAFGAACWAVG